MVSDEPLFEEPGVTQASSDDANDVAIAVIGMAGRFPGASDVAAFWRNLREGKETISFFTPEELEAAGVPAGEYRAPGYVAAKGVLDGADLFDAGFFGFTPRESELMDPQHRVFLECAWSALEDAGQDPERYAGLIGVFAGSSNNTYLRNLLEAGDAIARPGLDLSIAGGKDFLTTWVSYKLNLAGPSVVVQSACSTSLVAVCEACQCLLDYRCDMALAGGVSVGAPRVRGYLHAEGGIGSADGHCRAFDHKATGTVAGEGVGIVALKRLEDALAHGDSVLAVIRGSAVNNDGSAKVGYTAPSVTGQAEVIAAAQAMADVDPATIKMIEAHGTGTSLGDPIEIAALKRAFGDCAGRSAFCAIGSVKSNIGHLDAAAGIAGFIKTVLSLRHREIPPSLHFEKANPELGIDDGPFYVNARLTPWPAQAHPRRASVSSFGIGGTNAHVVLEEAPGMMASDATAHPQLLTISARSESALESATGDLAAALRERDDLSLADVAFTRLAGRRRFAHRRFVVCRSRDDAIETLGNVHEARVQTIQRQTSSRSVVFMFPGQGTQRAGMGRTLYTERRRYREVIDACAERLRPELGLDLRDLLFAEDGDAALAQTDITQPALFATEYALAQQLIEFNIKPGALIGHSIGEYVAACLSGVMSLPDALRVVAARGRLMQSAPPGAMLAVSMPPAELAELLPPSVSMAAVNAPSQCVASGPVESIDALHALLEDRQVMHQRMVTAHAFHSATMDCVLEEFRSVMDSVTLAAPRIPLLSNLTGTWLESAQASDAGYWVAHLRDTVRFADGMARALADGHTTFLEVGPGEVLSRLARAVGNWTSEHAAIPTLGRGGDAHEALLVSVGAMWADGLDIDATALHAGERRLRVSLPGYPFERKRYWIEAPAAPRKRGMSRRKIDDVGKWLYLPDWSRRPIVRPGLVRGSRWLVIDDSGAAIVERAVTTARERGAEVELVKRGADVRAALMQLRDAGGLPDVILDTLGLGTEARRDDGWVDEGALSHWLSLINAAGEASSHAPVRLVFLTTDTQDVMNGDRPNPGAAVINGLAAASVHDYPELRLQCIDLDDVTLATGNALVLDSLAADIARGPDAAVAYRGGERWVQGFDRIGVDRPDSGDLALRERGVYLITGGLGKIGLALAEDLATRVAARLVLTTRRTLPRRDRWDSVTDAGLAATIAGLRRIEQAGGEVAVVTADPADPAQVIAAVAEVESRFGRIDGVVHAAGITSGTTFGPMNALTLDAYREQLAAKAGGALALVAALDGRAVDFCVLMSSLSSAIGAQGFAPYASANAFLDALAASRERTTGTRWLAIGFDGWRFGENTAGSALADMAMLPAEGIDAFYRALSVPAVPRMLVCTTDLNSRRLTPEPHTVDAPHAGGESFGGTMADGAGPKNATERAIHAVWRAMFGLEAIGRDDDFFQLGGHSLLALRLSARLSNELRVTISAAMVMEHGTVAKLAAMADELRDFRSEVETEALLGMVENLSEEEVAELLDGGSDKENLGARAE
jgi:acyl transferase domain-containing protein